MSSSSSSPPPDRDGTLLRLPLHDLPQENALPGVVRRGKGRPKKILPAPTHDQLVYQQQRAEDRARHEAADPLVRALKDGSPSHEVIHVSLCALAEESAALLWERQRAEARGIDAALTCTRRIDALAKLASLVLDIERLGVTDMIASAATIKKLKDAWLRTVRGIVCEVIPGPEGERLLLAYETRLADAETLGGREKSATL